MIYQVNRARHNPAKIKRIYEYSYKGKLEKNRKKNIYIARLKKKYLRCLKEYEQKGLKRGESSKKYCLSPSDTAECLFSKDQTSNKEYKNDLSLNEKQKKPHNLKEKEIDIQEQKHIRVKNRLKRYKIMTQVTKKGQPKLDKRIDLLLEKIKDMV
ncbi:hypothetical protein PNEG_01267 [Pneumocystis murina B123]|uniref:rRNA-processing protein FYV7 n=1 Tax=Pneumocystis murina (strain B123) TaxID=1069680 RepID=M7NTW9_PNEMU|nr:hypothetical protein PNEG_01267 [Pneumocystis murina B123]EMR10561.1 hypothetical protein PNEG_01267 [Pneumocystis murina B123]